MDGVSVGAPQRRPTPEEVPEPAPGPAPEGPRATVVIPCYNQAHFLGECLASVVAQTYPYWEAVVVDDCSPDGDDIARVVEEVGDARIRLVRHAQNKGLGGSRNTGIRESRTEFVLPLDSDDRITPRCLETLVGALEEDPELHCAFADVQLFGRLEEVLEFPGPPPGRPLLRAPHTIPGAGTMMRRDLWERLGGYDEAEVLRMGREDFEFWIRAFAAGCRFKRFREPVYEYRHLNTSMNVVCRLQDHEIAEYIYRKHRSLYDREGEGNNFRCFWAAKASAASYREGKRWRAFLLGLRSWRMVPTRRRFLDAVRSLLPSATNDAINAGELRRLVPFVGYPMSDKGRGAEEHRPFFVIGVGGSGNRILEAVLNAHPDLSVPPETFVLGEVTRRFPRYARRMTWPDLVSWVLSRFQFRPEFEALEMDLVPALHRLEGLHRRQRNLANILDVFYREHARQHGREPKRWGDKTPLNSLCDAAVQGSDPLSIHAPVPETLVRLRRVFPAAQFVHVYRDGCDAVHSFLRGGFFSRLEDAARWWLQVERQTRRFADEAGAQAMHLRFEDLVGDTEPTVRRLCEFLGVSFREEMVRAAEAKVAERSAGTAQYYSPGAEPTTVDQPGLGRPSFSVDERRKLQALLGEMLAESGYPPATSDPG